MSSRYRKNKTTRDHLRLSAHKKVNKWETFKEYRQRQKEAKQAINDAPSELIVPKVEPSTSEFQASFDSPHNEPSEFQASFDSPHNEPSESKFDVSNAFYIKGRRIVDFNFFLMELQKLNKHSTSGCSLNDITIISEDIIGLLSCFYCKCKVCNFEKVVWTEDPGNINANINSDAVAGLVSVGCGFRNMREIFTKMDIPTLTGTLFSKEYDKLSQLEVTIDENEIGTAEEEAIMIVEYNDDGLGTDDEGKTFEERVIKDEQDASTFGRRNRSGELVSDAIITIVDEMEERIDGIVDEAHEAVSEAMVPMGDRINTANEIEEPSLYEITNKEQETTKPKDKSDDDINKIIADDDNEEMEQSVVVANDIIIQDVMSLSTTEDGSFVDIPCVTNTLLTGQIFEDSGNPDTLIVPLKYSGKQPIFRCKDCSTDFQKVESLRVHRMYYCCNRIKKPSLLGVKNHTMVDSSDSPVKLTDLLPSLRSRLSVLKSTMGDMIPALEKAIGIAAELLKLINFQKAAKKHKELGLNAMEEAMAREKAITSSNSSNERLVVSDMKTRAVSEVKSALALEKYVDDTLEPTARKQEDVLKVAVETNSREQLALVEFEKVIEQQFAILTSEKNANRMEL